MQGNDSRTALRARDASRTERRLRRYLVVAKLQRPAEPFVGCGFCGQTGECAVERRWTSAKQPSNRLFLLSFLDPLSVHEIALAKCGVPYYAWYSPGTSTQDVVDFDSQALSGKPVGDQALGGTGYRGEIHWRRPALSLVAVLHETAGPAAKWMAGINNDKFRQERTPCN